MLKDLCVTIRNNLKWNTHISNVCTKANRTLGFLRRILYSCPPVVKEAAYKVLVRPVLEYGSSVWDPHTHGLQEELEKVQNCATRFVTGNYVFETGSMTGILGSLIRKEGKIVDVYCYPNVQRVKQEYPQMTLSRIIGIVEINTLWLFRYLQLAKKRTKIVSFD